MALVNEKEIALNRSAHKYPEYGAGGHKHAPMVKQLMDAYKTRSVLDYGCGKQTLSDAMGMPIRGYDPAIPGLDAMPEPADIVVCTDVLEYITEEDLPDILEHINSLTRKICLFIISTRTAIKYFHDGTNFHRTVKPANWWLERVMKYMDLHQFAMAPEGHEFLLTCTPKGTENAEFIANEQRMQDEIDSGDKEIVVIKEDGTPQRVRYGFPKD